MKQDSQPNLPVFRPGSEGLEKMLGKLEAQVMEAVWGADGAVCVDDVREALAAGGKEAAYTTIMTTLSRLHAKGLLGREQHGKAYYYTPRVSRRELTSGVTKQVIDSLLTTFAEPAMAYFVEALGADHPDKLEALADMIVRKQKSEKKK
ncbi:MAG: BlaI/MecI/CopY family transcriptional regulator [Armatimonadetes bacterium]|nr:BlaI/MecI/CopY family transcriptional regulator [Armatimonadota bacterium]